MISQLFSLRLMGAKVHISLQKKECFQPAFRTEPILFVATQCFTFAESVATNPAKDNICRVLSSSNVDKLKKYMWFQLSTAGFQRKMIIISSYAERLHRGIVPLHPKTNGSMAEW